MLRDQPKDIDHGQPATPGSLAASVDVDWVQLARECHEASTNWINGSRRAKWTDSLRMFQNLHPTGSKYLSTDYRYRSRYFRPKTRAMVRRDEAAAAAAFFSNEDVVSIMPNDDDNAPELASAEIMKSLLQYRLTKTVPWFLTVVGARQDADVMGICVSKQYWRYGERYSHTRLQDATDEATGQPVIDQAGNKLREAIDVYMVDKDGPVVDLIAAENIRFDPGSDWRDPVGTSPYLIEMIPMYVADVLERMEEPDARTGRGPWKKYPISAILSASSLDDDATRRTREAQRIPGKDHDGGKPRHFDIAWIHENIIRRNGKDWHYFTLGRSGNLLTDPVPLDEVYLHGMRPYSVGFTNLETHKSYPAGKAELTRDLQLLANDILNSRKDNLNLVLNPRQFVKQGSGIDIQDLRTFMPGKTMLVPDPTSIVWDRPPDVTGNAYQEQDRVNIDFDDIAGGFNAASMASAQNPVVPETVGGMEHMAAPAATLTEYELRLFAETWVEPTLRQLVKLEQAYETDPVVLAIAGKKANLLQRFGINQITDELLNRELTIRVNVGIGATNPATKLNNFVKGGQILASLFGPALSQGANFQEINKEVWGLLGYKDGARFFYPGFDPRQAAKQMQAQQQQQGGQKGAAPDPHRVQAVTIQAQGKIKERQIQAMSDENVARIEFQKDQMAEQAETQRAIFNAQRELMTMPHTGAFPGMAPVHRAPHPALHGLMPGF